MSENNLTSIGVAADARYRTIERNKMEIKVRNHQRQGDIFRVKCIPNGKIAFFETALDMGYHRWKVSKGSFTTKYTDFLDDIALYGQDQFEYTLLERNTDAFERKKILRGLIHDSVEDYGKENIYNLQELD